MGKHLVWWPLEGSKLGGQWGNILLGGHWKVPSLVAFEMNPMLGGQWGSILFSGHWKVPRLIAFGRKKEKLFFYLFPFSTT
jgi:hypothetical protein